MANNNVIEMYKRDIERQFQAPAESATLNHGGGGGTSDGMDIVDAKIAAAEARTDAKFAQMMGELKAIDKSTSGLKATMVLTGLTTTAVVVAIFAWGTAMFGTGMDAQIVADRAASTVEQRLSSQLNSTANQYEELKGRIDAISMDNAEKWAQVLDAIQSAPPAGQE
jgi:hypothetical protein